MPSCPSSVAPPLSVMSSASYDVIIIGAGLSGLSAALRLSHFGRRVAVFERHHFPGGLNSYYYRNGELVDVGLHALTNFVSAKERGAPLNTMLRQLRLRRAELGLCPQNYSLIEFPSASLRLSNDFNEFSAALSRLFPQEAAGFASLVELIRQSDCYGTMPPGRSARQQVAAHISSPLLRDMLFMPLMFYGNPCVADMDFKQFCIMFHSIFLEGMGRPKKGMKAIIDRIVKRIRDNGGELFLGNGIVKLRGQEGRLQEAQDERGQWHRARNFISCIGASETAALCSEPPPELEQSRHGEIGFFESIFYLDRPAAEFGLQASTIFRSTRDEFHFAPPTGLVDFHSQVYCLPGNYIGCEDIPAAKQLRLTHLANPKAWLELEETEYRQAKAEVLHKQREILAQSWPRLEQAIVAVETQTPQTIRRYSGRLSGCIYGSPDKLHQGKTSCQNLILSGSDQGLLGIVGTLISGISMVNQHLF